MIEIISNRHYLISLSILVSVILIILKQYLLRRYKLKNKIEAKAIVLAKKQLYPMQNDEWMIELQLQVFPVRARNFVSECNQVFTEHQYSSINIGSTLKVVYKENDLSNISIIY